MLSYCCASEKTAREAKKITIEIENNIDEKDYQKNIKPGFFRYEISRIRLFQTIKKPLHKVAFTRFSGCSYFSELASTR
tara:strand:+ start:171 stop:407 length:237 start_codon:yes stop_codon:yes gene_type:complete